MFTARCYNKIAKGKSGVFSPSFFRSRCSAAFCENFLSFLFCPPEKFYPSVKLFLLNPGPPFYKTAALSRFSSPRPAFFSIRGEIFLFFSFFLKTRAWICVFRLFSRVSRAREAGKKIFRQTIDILKICDMIEKNGCAYPCFCRAASGGRGRKDKKGKTKEGGKGNDDQRHDRG